MKWLLLILLFSCGKHESPPAADLGDLDGDQILNHQETSSEQKYIANFETLGAINGVLKIHHASPIEVKFSNKISDKSGAIKLITGRESDLSHREYFSEWNDLELNEPSDSLNLDQKVYTLYLQFESTGVKPDELYLIEGNERTLLGNWIQSMRITLSREKVLGILSGKSVLSLKKKLPQVFKDYMTPDQSIKEKTYRVFLFDGNKSTVYYVSRELPFEDFKFLNIIDTAKTYSEEEAFFNDINVVTPTWFERTFKNGDQALVYVSPLQLKETLLQRFQYSKSVIQRSNGIPHAPLSLTSSKGSVYLRIKGMKTERKFQESVHHRRYQRGGSLREEGYVFNCDHHIREISSEIKVPVTLHGFMKEVEITQGVLERVEEYVFTEGVVWEMKLHPFNQGIGLNLRPQTSTNYVTTGEFNTLCTGNYGTTILKPAQKTSIEGNLVFEIESYVEKYQD